jgi:hypothetical protein
MPEDIVKAVKRVGFEATEMNGWKDFT